MIKQVFLLYCHLLISFLSSGQPLTSDFELKDTVCLNEDLNLVNLSANANNFVWDFSMKDLGKDPSFTSVFEIESSSFTSNIDIIYDSGNWYGFVTDYLTNQLYKMDYGKSLNNIPTLIESSNYSNFLSQPNFSMTTKDNGVWYNFIINYGNNDLIRLTYGDGLNNDITIGTNIGNLGSLSKPFGFDIINEANNYILIVSNNANNTISLINFGESLSNNPSTANVITIGSGYGITGASRITVIKSEDNWFGFLCARNNKIYRIDFGPVVFDTEYNIVELIEATWPEGIAVTKEGLDYFGYVAGRDVGLYKLYFGNSLENFPQTELIGKLGAPDQFKCWNLVRDTPGWRGFTTSRNGGLISKFDFSDQGEGNLLPSTNFEPNNVNYNSPGAYAIELTAFDEFGNFNILEDTIVVKNASAPTTSFTTTNTCISNPNTFSASTSDDPSITSWSWDFGDGIGTASGQNVNYQFLDTGNFEVKLSIESQNGCSNTSKQLISIFNPPQAGFTYTKGVVCSNSPLEFSNNTVFYGPDSLISFQWDMSGEGLTSEKNPSYTFTSGGDKSITLTASIPGCSSESSEIISITPGPLTGFTPGGSCVYDNYTFTNTTTGDDITGYLWNFGDGYTSTNTSPTHQFEAGGTYAVSLTASNVLGCNTTLKQVVPVHFTPTPNFTNDLACSENSVKFYDQSSVTNANITDQQWTLVNHDLGFEQRASGPSPNFQLGEAGNYEMTLIATSNYGCSDTLVRNDINVRPSPTADFAYENLCFGDSTLFSEIVELPANVGLNSVEWLIEGDLIAGNDVKYKFNSPGEYQVEMYVRADNFCTDYSAKNLSILPLPEIGIDLSAFCEDQPVTIYSSINSVDQVITYNWQINNTSVSNLESFEYNFDKADLYDIGLGVTTENNCYNFQSQIFAIHPSPVSEFELFPSIGANPLNVAFTDLSQGASKVLYDFSTDNDDTSEDFNPNYTYTKLGKEWPKQIVGNDFGCTDTSYNEVEVIIPVYDLKLSKANIEIIDQKLKMVIEVTNNGTIIVNNPEVKIDIDEKISLSHKLECRLWPGDQQSFEIDFDVLLNNQSLNYICFALNTELGNYQDVNPFDNSECLSIESTFNVLEPYPNPSRDFVFVPIILPSPGDCQILMANEKGSTLFQKDYKNLKSGLNLFKIELSIYNQGLYMLVIKHEQFENTKKIVIN